MHLDMSSSDLIMRASGHIICEPDNATNIKIWPELCTPTDIEIHAELAKKSHKVGSTSEAKRAEAQKHKQLLFLHSLL